MSIVLSYVCEELSRQDLLNKAVECVSDAVLKLNFRDFITLRTDPDFAPLQKLDEYRELLDAAERG